MKALGNRMEICSYFELLLTKKYLQHNTIKKSQHGCVRWALREHLPHPCHDFACGGLQSISSVGLGRRIHQGGIFKGILTSRMQQSTQTLGFTVQNQFFTYAILGEIFFKTSQDAAKPNALCHPWKHQQGFHI